MKKTFSIILLLVTFAFVQGCGKNETKPLTDEVDDYRASVLVIEDEDEGEIVGAVIGEKNVDYLSYSWNYDDIFNDQTYFFTCTDYERHNKQEHQTFHNSPHFLISILNSAPLLTSKSW